jgi:hypothetical protein
MILAQGPWNTQVKEHGDTVGVCCAHHFGVGEGTVISGTALPAHATLRGSLRSGRSTVSIALPDNHLGSRTFPTSRWLPRTGLTLWPSRSGRQGTGVVVLAGRATRVP